MATNFSIESFCTEDKKNIKNIYVQKINSLMKLSKDTLLKDDIQNSNNNDRKKLKKIASEVDKNTLKLQKNRQSAKKARLRKKIYIKMLQSQIDCFKRLKTEGEQLNQESELFLSNQKDQITNNQMNELIEHDVNVDKFLSGNDFGEVLKIQNKEYEKKLNQRDKVIQELYQLCTTSLIRKLKQSKSNNFILSYLDLQVFQPILKKQAKDNMKNFENLVKRIVHHYDLIKNSFRKIHELTQKSKGLSRNCRNDTLDHFELRKFSDDLISVSEFMEKLNLNRQNQYQMQDQQKLMIEQQYPYTQSKNSLGSISPFSDLNLHATQKLLIRSQKFFENTLFQEQQ